MSEATYSLNAERVALQGELVLSRSKVGVTGILVSRSFDLGVGNLLCSCLCLLDTLLRRGSQVPLAVVTYVPQFQTYQHELGKERAHLGNVLLRLLQRAGELLLLLADLGDYKR